MRSIVRNVIFCVEIVLFLPEIVLIALSQKFSSIFK
jgi:hypothetical protein